MLHRFVKGMAPLAALALGAGLSGCGSVDMTINGKEGVPLSELDMSGNVPNELVVAGSDKVVVTEGDTLDITIDGSDEAAARIRFVRDGDMLGVTRDSDTWDDDGSATVRVTMAAPREIVIAGSGSVESATVASTAEAVIGGSGSMTIDRVEAERLEISIGGSGSVKAAGTAKTLELAIGGSGSANLRELTADDAEISIGGSGSVNLRSDGTVEANIAGSGGVNVVGSARCTLNSLGSGTLTCKPDPDAPAATEEEPEADAEPAEES